MGVATAVSGHSNPWSISTSALMQTSPDWSGLTPRRLSTSSPCSTEKPKSFEEMADSEQSHRRECGEVPG